MKKKKERKHRPPVLAVVAGDAHHRCGTGASGDFSIALPWRRDVKSSEQP